MTDGRWPVDRRPDAVPDDPGEAGRDVVDLRRALDVHGGVDTDADGYPDTLLTDDGTDLLVLTDLDDDGLADRVLRIGPDGAVRPVEVHPAGLPDVFHAEAGPGDSSDGDGPRQDAGAGSFWGRLLDDLFGPGG